MAIITKTSVDFSRIFDLLPYQAQKYPNPKAVNFFKNEKWVSYSIQELQSKADTLSCWFISNGYTKGDKIIFVPQLGNAEWMILDFACQQIGLITVPVHPTSRPEEIEVILKETEAKLCVTADNDLYFKFTLAIENIGCKTLIYHLKQDVPGHFYPLDVASASSKELSELQNLKKEIQEDDLLT